MHAWRPRFVRDLLRRLPIHPFELASIVMLGGVTGFLWLQGLRIDWRSAEYTARAMVELIPLTLVFGVGAQGAWVRINGGSLRDYLRRALVPAWLGLWARLWLACWIASFSYFWLKVCIPLYNTATWDTQLWDLDAMLHGGVAPALHLIGLLEGSFLLTALDRWYAYWLVSLVLGLAFFAASPSDLTRRRVLLSCVMLWALGAAVYGLLPAQGPVYSAPEHWQGVAGTMPRAEAAQNALRQNYTRVVGFRTEPAPFQHTLGIAAFPSLHVAFHWLFALWARSIARWLFWLLVATTLATFVGSLVTGWHYAVDGYAGVALASLCYALAKRIDREPDTSAVSVQIDD